MKKIIFISCLLSFNSAFGAEESAGAEGNRTKFLKQIERFQEGKVRNAEPARHERYDRRSFIQSLPPQAVQAISERVQRFLAKNPLGGAMLTSPSVADKTTTIFVQGIGAQTQENVARILRTSEDSPEAIISALTTTESLVASTGSVVLQNVISQLVQKTQDASDQKGETHGKVFTDEELKYEFSLAALKVLKSGMESFYERLAKELGRVSREGAWEFQKLQRRMKFEPSVKDPYVGLDPIFEVDGERIIRFSNDERMGAAKREGLEIGASFFVREGIQDTGILTTEEKHSLARRMHKTTEVMMRFRKEVIENFYYVAQIKDQNLISSLDAARASFQFDDSFFLTFATNVLGYKFKGVLQTRDFKQNDLVKEGFL